MSLKTLSQTIYNHVSTSVNEYIDKLVAEFKLDKEKAQAIWNSSVSDEIKITSETKKAPAKRAPTKKKADDGDDSKKCQYVYQKGAIEGKCCGSKVSEESESGKFCKKHLGQETKKADAKKPEKKTSAAAPKKESSSKAEAKEVTTDVIKSLKQSIPEIKIAKNSFGNYEHQGTGLLIDRPTKEVYGKQKSDGSVLPLTSEDIDDCKRLGFKYRVPEKIVGEEKDEEEESDVEAEEDDEDEENDDE